MVQKSAQHLPNIALSARDTTAYWTSGTLSDSVGPVQLVRPGWIAAFLLFWTQDCLPGHLLFFCLCSKMDPTNKKKQSLQQLITSRSSCGTVLLQVTNKVQSQWRKSRQNSWEISLIRKGVKKQTISGGKKYYRHKLCHCGRKT